MKFMFTIYHDENVLDAMPEKETQALVNSAIEYAEEIQTERPLPRLGRSAAGRWWGGLSSRRETAVP